MRCDCPVLGSVAVLVGRAVPVAVAVVVAVVVLVAVLVLVVVLVAVLVVVDVGVGATTVIAAKAGPVTPPTAAGFVFKQGFCALGAH